MMKILFNPWSLLKHTIKQIIILLLFSIIGLSYNFAQNTQVEEVEALNIVIIGAHPDDVDVMAGGTAYKWAESGCNVLLVSLTNGDAGHQTIDSKELAIIRREEARKAGEVIGAKYITLDNHDGQLMPTYENRLQVIKIIREHNADIVISHRPYDYHPDHRYTATLVLDAAYMVTVPKILPKVPFLKKNPLFLYMSDSFSHPEPFKADVAIAIDDVIEKKMDMIHQHVSQMYEWLPFNEGILDQVPVSDRERRIWLGEIWKNDESSNSTPYKNKLIELYGDELDINYCEAFQDSQYGTRLTKENLYFYFPFLSTINMKDK